MTSFETKTVLLSHKMSQKLVQFVYFIFDTDFDVHCGCFVDIWIEHCQFVKISINYTLGTCLWTRMMYSKFIAKNSFVRLIALII